MVIGSVRLLSSPFRRSLLSLSHQTHTLFVPLSLGYVVGNCTPRYNEDVRMCKRGNFENTDLNTLLKFSSVLYFESAPFYSSPSLVSLYLSVEISNLKENREREIERKAYPNNKEKLSYLFIFSALFILNHQKLYVYKHKLIILSLYFTKYSFLPPN